MQINTTVKYHYTSIRSAKLLESNKYQVLAKMTCVNWHNDSGKQFNFSRRVEDTYTRDSGSPFLVLKRREIHTHMLKETHTRFPINIIYNGPKL